MPRNKKEIHDLFSPRIAEKRKARKDEALRRAREAALKKEDPPAPAKVDNYKVNKPLFGPHKIRGKVAPVVLRKISPTEGRATVNAKTGKAVKALIHKPRSRKAQVDPAIGAIDKIPDKNRKSKDSRKPRRLPNAN